MERKQILIEALAEVDDDMGELYLMEEEPTEEQFYESIRRSTLNLSFTPVFVGSAFKNRGVQPLLNGIERYLPNPTEINNIALDRSNEEEEVPLKTDHDAPLVALAFKLEEGQFGQLTYLRVYQGVLKKGAQIVNTSTGKKMKVPRTVRMHSADMEDVNEVGAGEICAMFGVECNTGDTFCDPGVNL